nr:hypothetical protein [Peribacillus deserti]
MLVILLSAFTPLQKVTAESISVLEKEGYFTTEDIVADIVFPTIDQRVIKEYGQDALIGWQWKRIQCIKYNTDHSYTVYIKIEVPSDQKELNYIEDLVKVKISPSCDSEKLNKLLCNHGFKIDVLDYKHLNE